MSDVVIVGLGQTDVGEHYGISLRDLALLAIEPALQDAGGLKPDILFVGNMIAPAASHQAHLGALISDYSGLEGIEASTIEAGGASGGAALRMGYLAVKSGEAKAALVLGLEKTTDQLGPGAESMQTLGEDSDYEAVQGLTPNAQAALLMRRYMHQYGVAHEAFAGFPILAHANAMTNPHAMYHNRVTKEAYQNADPLSDPLTLFDTAPVADGAAAVLLTLPELLPTGYAQPLVRITGSSLVTDRLAIHDRPDPLAFDAAQRSVERACRQAGILPTDVDLFELYDSYSIYAALALEASGFSKRGQGWKLAQDGVLSRDGELPIATFGGLKARGNPGGATGVYQAMEATLQLRGQAGLNQVAEAHKALIQCLAGPASTAVTHVLEAL
ncbi:MAG: thiolase domain-containing protein [Anaerolineae bacterium]|nr:thiolase domain-containing protein [Anaerolineae bacterium]